jgi:signal transduction histidine kinase
MIANSAFLAAMVMLLLLFWVMGQLEFLAPYKHAILPRYLWTIVGSVVVLFLNLFAVFYTAARRLFLKDTGRKLAHVERQLRTPDTVVRDLSERLAREE